MASLTCALHPVRILGILTCGLILGSCGGGEGTGPIDNTPPNGGAGRYVLWTRASQALPLTVTLAATGAEVGQVTTALTSPPACGSPGSYTIDAPASGSTGIEVFNLPVFGNATFALGPTSGCKPIEVPFVPVEMRIVALGTGSGQVASGSRAIDCVIVDGKTSGSGCTSTRTLGTKFSLIATPSSGSTFVGYKDACPGIGAGAVCAVTTTTGGTTLTVEFAAPQPAAVASVTLTPPSGFLYVGETGAFGVTLKDAAGNVLTGRQISWSSSSQNVASAANNGVITGVAAGTSTVTATSEGKTGSALVTVLPRPPEPAAVSTITLTPATGALFVGQSGAFVVTLRDAAGNILTGRTLAWSTSNAAIANVAPNGLVNAVSVGTATITATTEGKSGSATVTVSTPPAPPAPVATVSLSPPSALLYLGDNGYFTLVLKDASGNALSNRVVTWSTSNATVATVANDGLVVGRGIGSATITATSEGKSGPATVTVTSRPNVPTNLCTLIGGGRIIAADGKFLGSLTNRYNAESVLNQYGNYGSPYSVTSIYNKYGDYGSAYSIKSPYDPYTSTPPKLFLVDGTFFWLTVNTSFASNSSVHPDFLKTCTTFP